MPGEHRVSDGIVRPGAAADMHCMHARSMRRAGEEGALRLVGVLEVNGFVTGTLQVLCDGA